MTTTKVAAQNVEPGMTLVFADGHTATVARRTNDLGAKQVCFWGEDGNPITSADYRARLTVVAE